MKRLTLISAACIFLFFGVTAASDDIDEIKVMRNKTKTKYNKKISMYDAASKKDYTGEWHLILADGNNHGTLIIKKIGDTYYAELFGANHWKGVGYAYKDMLLFSFKYTNETDAGFVTFRLKSPRELETRSIDYDGTFRWQGVYTRPK